MRTIQFSAKKLVGVLLVFTIFFPFVGFIRIGDIQPNFALLGILILFLSFLFEQYQQVNKIALFVFLFFFILLSLRIFWGENGFEIRYLFTYLLSITVPFLIWHFFKKKWLYLSLPLLGFISITYLVVAIIQIGGNQQFLAEILPRAEVAKAVYIIETGRGVRSLTSEPSVFGKVLTYLNVIYIFLELKVAKDKIPLPRILLVSFFYFISNLFLAQSFYGLVIHGIILIILLLLLSPSTLIILLASLGFLVSYFSFALPGFRLNLIFQAVQNLNLEFLMSQGAFARVMNVPISIYGGINALPMGFGNTDQITNGQFVIFGKPYFFFIGKRNLGGFIEFFLRFGLIGFSILIFYFAGLLKILKNSFKTKFKRMKIGYFFAFSLFLLTFLDGSTTDPLAWFSFLFLLNHVNEDY
jgi:hypothetical protein